ncbi:MAG: histidine kinase [Trueperaceae bacterium]
MTARRMHVPLETIAGLLAWGVVALPLASDLLSGARTLGEPRVVTAVLAWAAFGALFLSVASWSLAHLTYRTHRILLALQTAAAMTVVAAFPEHGTSAILLILTAVVAAHVLPDDAAIAWVVVQGAFLTGVVASVAWPDGTTIALQGAGYTSFMLFAYVTTRSGLRESRSRAERERRNAELRATRSLLAEHQRSAERLRIARDLHDGIGHHLTALILNLEVARRSDGEAGREARTRAEELARSLLEEVRDTVRAVRADEAIDVADALRTLVAELPEPEVTLSLPERVAIIDADAAHALVRCAQEAVTNVVRHADARRLWLSVRREEDRVVLEVRDDGRGGRPDGMGGTGAGTGLTGLRERLAAVGGRLDVTTAPGRGFAVTADVPSSRVVAGVGAGAGA